MKIHVGCCGWSYFQPGEFLGGNWKDGFGSVLEAYASKFDCVEINSTFYGIPKIPTAEKWFREARAVNKKFVFTVKCSGLVTHRSPFGKQAVPAFNLIRRVCEALHADIMLLQSPASFGPTKQNIEKMEKFFAKTRREGLKLAWEPRGKWWNEPALVKDVCEKYDLVNCVDPLRNEPRHFGTRQKTAYFRLHGFGWPSMYGYDFSDRELQKIAGKVSGLGKARVIKDAWIMFNNAECYGNALKFESLFS